MNNILKLYYNNNSKYFRPRQRDSCSGGSVGKERASTGRGKGQVRTFHDHSIVGAAEVHSVKRLRISLKPPKLIWSMLEVEKLIWSMLEVEKLILSMLEVEVGTVQSL